MCADSSAAGFFSWLCAKFVRFHYYSQSAPRGGHAGGGGGGHGGGATRTNTLDLSKHVDHPVIVKLSGGRQGRFALAWQGRGSVAHGAVCGEGRGGGRRQQRARALQICWRLCVAVAAMGAVVPRRGGASCWARTDSPGGWVWCQPPHGFTGCFLFFFWTVNGARSARHPQGLGPPGEPGVGRDD